MVVPGTSWGSLYAAAGRAFGGGTWSLLWAVALATFGCSDSGDTMNPGTAELPTGPPPGPVMMLDPQEMQEMGPGPEPGQTAASEPIPAAMEPEPEQSMPDPTVDPEPTVPGMDAMDPEDPMDPTAMGPDGQGEDPEVPMDEPDAPADDGPLNMAPVKFGPNVMVSERSGSQYEVTMEAGPDGLIFVGWMDGRNCGFGVSTDGGETWGNYLYARTQASNRGAFAGDPAVAIDDAGNLYAGCQDYASGGLGTNYILLAHSKDKGETWSEFKRVNQSLDKPWLGATKDGVVLLSWLGRPGGVKRSTDYGETWEETHSLGYINHGTTLSIAQETGLVHMAYNTRETTVTYKRSDDFGETFSRARDLSSQGRPCRSPCSPRSHPIVGSDTDPTGQVVAVTWASTQSHDDAEGDDDVWVIVSYDGGDTFSDPIRVNDNMNRSRQFQSWAAVDKYGAVHVVWTDMRDNGRNATYYARMTDIEMGFEPNVEVTDGTGRAASFLGDYKGIDIQGRDVVVTWADTRNGNGDIYFARAKEAAAAGGPLMP